MDDHRGGLTFVFTDIEGSTQLVRDLGGSYGLALRIHRRILESCFAEQAGQEIGSEGDGLFFVFSTPQQAVTAAVVAQEKVDHYTWPEGIRLRVRMGIHCGPVTISGGVYVGLTVHEVSRICAAAHGGQILCSQAVAREVGDSPDHSLRDLGAFRLRGISEPRTLFQVGAPGLEDDFPPPRDSVRDGGVQVSIWRREPPRPPALLPVLPDAIPFRALDGGELEDDVRVEIRPASHGPAEAFRLLVRREGTIEEEYDGLTLGGLTDAAAIVNTHSEIIRIVP